MSNGRTINVYCDESCHIEHDGIPVMVWGAIWCDAEYTRSLVDQVRAIKRRHGLKDSFEIKWTKVSPSKTAFYTDLADYFLTDPKIRFRGLLVPDKSVVDHAKFNQSHNDWYYKMYFTMLKYLISPGNKYRIYLDVKDTRGGPKTRELHDVLCNNIFDFNRTAVERVEQIRSHESELLQIADLLIGAVGYANRNLNTNSGKRAVIDTITDRLGARALTQTSSFTNTKFNLLVWTPSSAA